MATFETHKSDRAFITKGAARRYRDQERAQNAPTSLASVAASIGAPVVSTPLHIVVK